MAREMQDRRIDYCAETNHHIIFMVAHELLPFIAEDFHLKPIPPR